MPNLGRRLLSATVTLVLLASVPPAKAALEADVAEDIQLRTETSRTFRERDKGYYMTESFTRQINYRKSPDSPLEPVDLTFRPDARNGRVATTVAGPVVVSLGTSDSRNGLLRVDNSRHSVTLRIPAGLNAATSTPSFGGRRAHFDDLVDGHIGLDIAAEPDGARMFFVLTQPARNAAFTVQVDAPGLTPSLRTDGAVVLNDADGVEVARLRRPYMMDSGARDGKPPAESEAVGVSLSAIDGWPAVTYVPDPYFLSTATYPVYVDPSVGFVNNTMADDAFVSSKFPTANYDSFQRADTGQFEMKVGPDPWDPLGHPENNVRDSLLRFDLSAIEGVSIPTTAAYQADTGDATAKPVELSFLPYDQYENTSQVWVSRADRAWDSTSVTWSTRPLPDPGSTLAIWTTAGVRRIMASETVADWVQDWVFNPTMNYGVIIHANEEASGNENDPAFFKRLISSEDSSGAAPKLVVHWFHPLTIVDDVGGVYPFSDIQADSIVANIVATGQSTELESGSPPLAEELDSEATGTTGVRWPINTAFRPGRFVGRMYNFDGSQNCIATPISRTLLISAAHCVFSDGSYHIPAYFYPRLNSGSTSGQARCTTGYTYVPKGFRDGRYNAPVNEGRFDSWDFALIKLYCQSSIQIYPMTVRWSPPPGHTTYLNRTAHQVGYPGAPCATATSPYLWGGDGKFFLQTYYDIHDPILSQVASLHSTIPTCPGDSGGPVYYIYQKSSTEWIYYLVGVSSSSYDPASATHPRHNQAAKMTASVGAVISCVNEMRPEC